MATIENKMRNDDDCLICFGNVNAKKTHIICDTCKKLYHHHCFRIWICRFKKEKVMPFSVTKIWDHAIKNKILYGFESKEHFVHLTDLEIYNKLVKNN